MEAPRARILFVCLGNICRSPMAEGAFTHAAREAGLKVDVDSAGTGGWHVGKPPDPRAIAATKRHGIDISHLRARQVASDDFMRFTHILAMDARNLSDLIALRPEAAEAKLSLLSDCVAGEEGRDVGDPYYGDDDGFERTWREVSAAAEALVARLSAGVS